MIKVLAFAAILAITTHEATGQTGTPLALVSIGDKLYLVPQSQLQSLLSPAPPAPRVKTSRKLPPPAPVVAEPEPVDPYPQFSYSYNVNDAETGDNKFASETRDGDKVSGSYSVVEPDGSIRTVTYTADAVNGFRATVDRQQGPVVYSQAAPTTTEQPRAYGRRVRVLRRRKLRPTAETVLNEE